MGQEAVAIDVDAILRQFRTYMGHEELSQKGAARQLGCSPSVLSQIFSKSYKGDVERHAAEMVRLMRRADMRKARPKRPEYRETPTGRRVLDALMDAHVEGVIVCVLGKSGVGKTMAALHYVAEEPTAIYIEGGPEATPNAVMKSLALAIDMPVRGKTWDLRQRIGKELKGSGRLVILDEIDYVPEPTLQTFRLIQDNSQVGFAVLGTPSYLVRLHGRRSATIDQWLNRIAHVEIINGCTREDIETIAQGVPLDSEALDELVTQSEGQARRAVHILIGMQRNGFGYKAMHVRMAARELMQSIETLRKRVR